MWEGAGRGGREPRRLLKIKKIKNCKTPKHQRPGWKPFVIPTNDIGHAQSWGGWFGTHVMSIPWENKIRKSLVFIVYRQASVDINESSMDHP